MHTRIRHYESEAYNLPTGVIYYVGPPFKDAARLQALILAAIDRVCPCSGYRFCCLEASENTLEAFLDMHPDIAPQQKERLFDIIAGARQAPGLPVRATLTTRIQTDDNNVYAFLEADITGCKEEDLPRTIALYAGQLRMQEQREPLLQRPSCSSEERQCQAARKSAPQAGLLRRMASLIPPLLHKEENKGCATDVCMSGADDYSPIAATPDLYEADASPAEADASPAEVDELLEELQRRLAAIPQTDGINILLQRHFEDFFRTLENLSPRPLSTLLIDDKLNILLPEYDMQIQMLPVWKAVYILFLRHEEGIILNQIADCRDEFAGIYKAFATGEPDNIEATINEVTTPGSDLFRQYKSKINAAFRQRLAEDIAQHYIIDGRRNEPYKIQLPRDKVVISCTRQIP